MPVLKMKNLEKPVKLTLGDVVKLEKAHRVEGKGKYAKVVAAEEVKDICSASPCDVCVLSTNINCGKWFVCSTATESTVLHPCTKSGELL